MRIASCSPAATEALFAMGAGDMIVCRDQFSDYPDAAKKIPAIMDHTEISAEQLRTYEPDIVVTGTSIQTKLAAQLRADGLTVIHDDPRTLRDVEQSIVHLGAIVNKEHEARAVTLALRQQLNDVQRKARLLQRKPRVYIEEWHMPPMASGNWVPELARIAGCEPFPIPAGALSRAVTLEEVARFDPDIIVISWCGAGSLADKELLTNRPGWDALKAVQTGRVRVIDDSFLNRPGPRLAEGARRLYGWAFELLH